MKIQVDYVRPTISLWLLYDLLIFERSKSDNHLFPDSQGSYNFTILQMFKCLTWLEKVFLGGDSLFI